MGDNKLHLLICEKEDCNHILLEFNDDMANLPAYVRKSELESKNYRDYWYRLKENEHYQYYNQDYNKNKSKEKSYHEYYKHHVVHFKRDVKITYNTHISEELFLDMHLNNLIAKSYSTRPKEIKAQLELKKAWWQRSIERKEKATKRDVENAISIFLETSKSATEVLDLQECIGKSGLYLMVLDEYNACYLGQSEELAQRIRAHWSKVKYYSGTGIDMYNCMDTTRIFILPIPADEYKEKVDNLEYDLVNKLGKECKNAMLNVIVGGKIGSIDDYNYEPTKRMIDILSKRR